MIETTAKEYCAFMISDPRKMKWFLLIHKKASMDMSKGIKRGGGEDLQSKTLKCQNLKKKISWCEKRNGISE